MSETQKRIAALKQQRKLTSDNQKVMRNKLAAFKEQLAARQAAAAKASSEAANGAGSNAARSNEQEVGCILRQIEGRQTKSVSHVICVQHCSACSAAMQHAL